MTVAIADVGCHGRLDLRFAARDGHTVITQGYCEVPFKITRLLHSTESDIAHLILMHTTAGIFGGDNLECTIHVERGARVRITQQSATKIHPSSGRLACQATQIHVESGAELVFDCEPMIPFAESRFSQKTRMEVAPGARLVYWEGFMAGRVGRNELWQFEEFNSETRVEMNGRPLFLDRFSLLPKQQSLDSAWTMRDASYLGTGLYVASDAPEVSRVLREALPHVGVDSLSPTLTAVRVASTNGPDFHHARQLWGQATQSP